MLDNTTFAFFSSPQEWGIIALVAIVLFGAKKLPEMARGLGEGMKEFKKAIKEVNEDEPATAPKVESAEEIEKRITK